MIHIPDTCFNENSNGVNKSRYVILYKSPVVCDLEISLLYEGYVTVQVMK